MSEYSSAENMITRRFFQKQAFTLEQQVFDNDEAAVDCSTATNILLWCKRNQDDDDSDALFTKTFTDFTVAGTSNNWLQCDLDVDDTDLQGITYIETLVYISAAKQYKLMFKADWIAAEGDV